MVSGEQVEVEVGRTGEASTGQADGRESSLAAWSTIADPERSCFISRAAPIW